MIEMLKQLSPVPIKFKNGREMSDIGLYFAEDTYYSPHIEIANDLEKHHKIAILAHEIGHALCSKKNCKCMINKDDHTLAEYHAFKFELEWLLKHKQRKALKSTVKNIKSCHSGPHKSAAKHIMRLKLWQKCLDYVGKI